MQTRPQGLQGQGQGQGNMGGMMQVQGQQGQGQGVPQGVMMGLAQEPLGEEDWANVYQLVLDLTHPEKRELALLDLSKKREKVPDLAPIIWHSVGTISALLQEIIAIYPLLSPPKLKAQASNRVCNALALLQCVASHRETRSLFINGMRLSFSTPAKPMN